MCKHNNCLVRLVNTSIKINSCSIINCIYVHKQKYVINTIESRDYAPPSRISPPPLHF